MTKEKKETKCDDLVDALLETRNQPGGGSWRKRADRAIKETGC